MQSFQLSSVFVFFEAPDGENTHVHSAAFVHDSAKGKAAAGGMAQFHICLSMPLVLVFVTAYSDAFNQDHVF